MSLTTLLNAWRTNPDMVSCFAAWRTLPAQPADLCPLPQDLHPSLAGGLKTLNIRCLYTHQATAWQEVKSGRHPVVVTGTASGKTLCYNLPVLDCLLRDPAARALYLFPTKALAQDQKDEIERLIASFAQSSSPDSLPVGVATYDGDTPAQVRAAIRSRARLLISNPDMLHTGILPHHTAWVDFMAGLRFIVIDEIHTYRGVFGSHVANVLRRLKRVAGFYGASPQFILTSATIGNPLQLAFSLVEEPIVLVDDDGAPKSAKHFVIYNPPIVNRELGLRRGVVQESVRLAQELLRHRVQTIVFSRTRRSVELILSYLRGDRLLSASTADEGRQVFNQPQRAGANGKQSMAIRGYRSGYLASERREIEHGLRSGQVRAVVATSALELGIDIGGMGAALLTGYPGTIAQTWQQAGRAGRQQEESLAVLLTSAAPLDQFLARHPDYFFQRSPEQALINPDHLLILLQHIRCAAFELPFQEGETFGGLDSARVEEFLAFLQETGVVHHTGDKFFWMADHYPAQDVSLRSATAETVVLHSFNQDQPEKPQTIGQVDGPSAAWMVHPQAIYLHEGQSYLVEDLDLETNIARLRPVNVDYYTEPRIQTTIQLVEKHAEAQVRGAVKSHGDILVTNQVIGFRRVQWFTQQQLGDGDLDMPPRELPTTGYWVALSDESIERLRLQNNWTGDRIDYGPNWSTQRLQARARDGFRCQVCGAPEKERAHDVHHKVPFRAFTSYRQANQLQNLVTLCPACHRRAEANVRIRSGLGGLAFALGNLAPLSLMCDARDVGVYADPQSPLADGRPTLVIYDQVPAGIGFSQRLFELHDELMLRARELVSECECVDGCPSCVGPGGEDGSGGKQEALAILACLNPPG